MGGGGSRYAMETSTEKVKHCDWLLAPHDHLNGKLNMNVFKVKVVIGKGKFGLVYTAQHIAASKHVAIKFISKEIIFETKAIQRIQQEIDILAEIHHPFIVHCFGVFEIDTCFGLVFDYASGGELFTRIKKENKFKEPVAKFYFCEMASALGYLHNKHIIFRDLKPENILIDNNGHIKICDFGFAVQLDSPSDTLTDGCGSAMYVAPEIAGGMMKNSHGLAVDWWSLGCILFEMVTGDPPFGDIESMSKFEIFNNINGKQINLPMSASTPLKDLVKGLLNKDPKSRWAKKQVMAASWVGDIDWKLVSSKKYSPPWVPPGRKSYNTANYLDWPKESLDKLKIPSREEAGYCSNLCIPQGFKPGINCEEMPSSKGKKHQIAPILVESKPVKAGANRKSLNKAGSQKDMSVDGASRKSINKAGSQRDMSCTSSAQKLQSRKSFKGKNDDAMLAAKGDTKLSRKMSAKISASDGAHK